MKATMPIMTSQGPGFVPLRRDQARAQKENYTPSQFVSRLVTMDAFHVAFAMQLAPERSISFDEPERAMQQFGPLALLDGVHPGLPAP